MKILHFISKYHTRIILFALILTAVIISVRGYNKSYEQNLSKIENIKELSDIICTVETAPQNDGNVSFEARIIKSKSKEIKGLKFRIILKNTKSDFLPGDTLRIKNGKLFAPDDKRNLGSFDEIEYQKSENLYGSIYSENTVKLKEKGEETFLRYLSKLKLKYSNSISDRLDKRCGSVALALLSGDKSGISDEDSANLKNSGVYHIVAISGLHLNIFIMLVSAFISRIRMKRLKKALLSLILCSITSVIVLIFTGFGLSVIRAFVMLLISLGSGVFARKYDSKNSLYLATGIILIVIPQSFFSIGFRLSVLSTLAVLISADILKKFEEYKPINNKYVKYILGVVITSMLCSLFTLPVMITSFGFLSLFSFLGNLFILPLTTPALICCLGFSLCSVLGVKFIMHIMSFVLSQIIWLILKITSLISLIPFGVVRLYPLYTFYALASIGVAASVTYYLIKKKKLHICIIISLILSLAAGGVFLYNKSDEKTKVIFADVGQGECAIIKLPHSEGVLIDFGTSHQADYVTDEIENTLIKLNIHKLSAAFVSHFHSDHTSALTKLLEKTKANTLYVPMYFDKSDEESVENYKDLLCAALLKPSKLKRLESGDKINIGKACFEILSPSVGSNWKANDMSMVIKFTYGKTSFLFTGDIEEDGTEGILKEDINCDVIKIPHHGGQNDKSNLLAQKAKAKYAVVSCGEDNSYGHPHKDTVKEFKKKGAKIYRTDKDGAISFTLDKNGIIKIEKMR